MKTIWISGLLVILIWMTACQKDHVDENKVELDSSTLEQIKAENRSAILVEDLIGGVNYFSSMEQNDDMEKSVALDTGCVRFSLEHANDSLFPMTVTVDFGLACTGASGHVKSGKMIITTSAPWYTEGAEREVTFDNYFVDSVEVTGKVTMVNEGKNSGAPTTAIESDLTLAWNDGKSVNRVTDHTRVFRGGWETPLVKTDDLIELSGTTTTTSSDGNTYVTEIKEPLLINGSCDDYVVLGVMSVTINEQSPVTINFGDGGCDSEATVSRNGESTEINFR